MNVKEKKYVVIIIVIKVVVVKRVIVIKKGVKEAREVIKRFVFRDRRENGGRNKSKEKEWREVGSGEVKESDRYRR